VYGWRVYGLGEQILTVEQQKKATEKIRQRFYWLKKELGKDKETQLS